jgi:hypothetical protein
MVAEDGESAKRKSHRPLTEQSQERPHIASRIRDEITSKQQEIGWLGHFQRSAGEVDIAVRSDVGIGYEGNPKAVQGAMIPGDR